MAVVSVLGCLRSRLENMAAHLSLKGNPSHLPVDHAHDKDKAPLCIYAHLLACVFPTFDVTKKSSVPDGHRTITHQCFGSSNQFDVFVIKESFRE